MLVAVFGIIPEAPWLKLERACFPKEIWASVKKKKKMVSGCKESYLYLGLLSFSLQETSSKYLRIKEHSLAHIHGKSRDAADFIQVNDQEFKWGWHDSFSCNFFLFSVILVIRSLHKAGKMATGSLILAMKLETMTISSFLVNNSCFSC